MFYFHLCLYFHYYAGVLPVFQAFSLLGVICGEMKQNGRKPEEIEQFALKAISMAFAMEVSPGE